MVKSRYNVSLSLRRNGELYKKREGENSTRTQHHEGWSGNWKLQLPPKIKFFMWRGLMNSLALRCKRIDVPNVCPLCTTEGETQQHVFFDCEFARAFLFACPLQLDDTRLGQSNMKACWEFLEWTQDQENSIEFMQLMAFGLWWIWKCQNAKVLRGVLRN